MTAAPGGRSAASPWASHRACSAGKLRDRGLVLFGDLPANRVTDRATGGVQRFEMLEQAVRGARAVHADQQLGLRGVGDLLQAGGQYAQVGLDGRTRPNGDGANCTQDGPSTFQAKLRRNGEEIYSFTLAPSWASEKGYDVGGPANHTHETGLEAILTLVGPGGGTPYDTGIPAQITGGTVTKAEEVTT